MKVAFPTGFAGGVLYRWTFLFTLKTAFPTGFSRGGPQPPGGRASVPIPAGAG